MIKFIIPIFIFVSGCGIAAQEEPVFINDSSNDNSKTVETTKDNKKVSLEHNKDLKHIKVNVELFGGPPVIIPELDANCWNLYYNKCCQKYEDSTEKVLLDCASYFKTAMNKKYINTYGCIDYLVSCPES